MRAPILCAVLMAALPPPVSAQTVTLTEADALARLAPDGPQARVLRADVDLARADELVAARWPNPRVAVTHEFVAGVAENTVLVTQALPLTGIRGLSIDAALARTAASEDRAGDALRRLRADLRRTFTAVWLAQDRAEVLAGARERVDALAGVLATREAMGDAAGFDRLRAEREVYDLEADEALARTALARARGTLTAFFATATDPATIVAVRSAPRQAPVPDLETLVARAMGTRGALLALRHDADAASLAADAARRRRVPEPEVVAGAKTSSALGGDTGAVVAVQASIPLFDTGGPERARATAEAGRADARAEAFGLQLRAEIAALRETVVERRAALMRYQEAVVASGEVERIARVSYDAGERSILELLDAYRTAADARLRLAELEAAVREAEIELEFVSGWEMPS
jgi:cobalt-zinc-cadmium efflux system outer membrane protein